MSFSLKSFRDIAEKGNLVRLNRIVNETNLCTKGEISVSEEYEQALDEILEIINHTNKQTAKKISIKLIRFFKENASTDYIEKFDYKIELADNPLSSKTVDLITMIYRNYLCSGKEKDILDEILRQNIDKPKTLNTTVPLFNTSENSDLSEKKVNCLIEGNEMHIPNKMAIKYSLDEELDESLEDDFEFNYYVNFRDSKLEDKIEILNKKNKHA